MLTFTETQTQNQTEQSAAPQPLQHVGNVTMLPQTERVSGSSRGLGRGRGGFGRAGRSGSQAVWRPAQCVADVEARLRAEAEENLRIEYEEAREEQNRLRRVMNSARTPPPQQTSNSTATSSNQLPSVNPPLPHFNPYLNHQLDSNAANIHVPSTPSTIHPLTQPDPLQQNDPWSSPVPTGRRSWPS